MNRFVVVLFAIFIASAVAFANQPTNQSVQQPTCNTVQECRDVISQAQARLQKLTGADESQRVSVTGAVFTRDTSMPALGEAYKDPSGLIWGSVVTNSQGKVQKMTQYAAEKYCASIGARLPTKGEFSQLATYLGEGTVNGYNPYLTDGKTEILPVLTNNWFWSASVYSDYRNSAWIFYGSYGDVTVSARNYASAVRCVGR